MNFFFFFFILKSIDPWKVLALSIEIRDEYLQKEREREKIEKIAERKGERDKPST